MLNRDKNKSVNHRDKWKLHEPTHESKPLLCLKFRYLNLMKSQRIIKDLTVYPEGSTNVWSSLRLTSSQFVSVRLSLSQFVSLRLSLSHFVSFRLSSSQFVWAVQRFFLKSDKLKLLLKLVSDMLYTWNISCIPVIKLFGDAVRSVMTSLPEQ